MTFTHTQIKCHQHQNRIWGLNFSRRFAIAFALLTTASIVLGGCGGSDNEPRNTSSRSNSLSSLAIVTVHVRDVNDTATAYNSWAATRPSQRDEGFALISPGEVPPGRSMVVVYPENRSIAFSGRDTFVDLQVVYAEAVGEGVGKITDIGFIGAFSRQPFRSSKLAKYALFVQNGDLARSGAKVGDLLFVPINTPSR